MASLTLDDFKTQPYEPKKYNRWLVTLPKEFNISRWVIQATQRPTVIFETENIKPIKLKFFDPLRPSTTQALWELYTNHDLHQDGFDYTLEMLDPTGVVVESWTIIGCKILEIDFGELDYSKDNPVECFMTIQPQKVKLNF